MFDRPIDARGRNDSTTGDGRPGDVRGFVHKKIGGFLKGVTGVIGGLGVPVISGVAKTISQIIPGGGNLSRSPIGRQLGFGNFGQTNLTPDQFAVSGQNLNVTPGCPPNFIRNALGMCIPIGGLGGGGVPGGGTDIGQHIPGMVPEGFACRTIPSGEKVCDMEFGAAVMGRFGAALQPAQGNTWINRCPTGTVLGKDGLCYNKRDISNSERKWPKGRAPLLTGGQMRAIGIASTAAKKLERTTKRLQGMGMMKKPSRSTRKALPAGRSVVVEHGPGSVIA
jgi:hypothetical protein